MRNKILEYHFFQEFDVKSLLKCGSYHWCVCVCPSCCGPSIMNAESRGPWMEALRAFDRQRIIEDKAPQTDWSGFDAEMLRLCLHLHSRPHFQHRTIVKLSHWHNSVKWHSLWWSASISVTATKSGRAWFFAIIISLNPPTLDKYNKDTNPEHGQHRFILNLVTLVKLVNFTALIQNIMS